MRNSHRFDNMEAIGDHSKSRGQMELDPVKPVILIVKRESYLDRST